MNRMKLRGLCLVVTLMGAVSVHGFELEVEMLTGSDSNPNRLAETFDVDPAVYAITHFNIGHTPRRTGFYIDLDAVVTGYLGDEDAVSDPEYANEIRGSGALGFKWRPRFKYGRAKFTWEVYGGLKDSRYVRKSTGQIARTPENATGTLIENRFDATWSGFETKGMIHISDEADFIYDFYVESKQYEEILGTTLSNLNYQQGEIDIGFEKRIWPRVNLKTMIGAGIRLYEDRRAKEVSPTNTGADIPGTELEFSYLEVENTLEYLITDRWKWQIGFDIDQRQDNEDGYYDSTEGQLFTRFRYRNKDVVRFLLSMSYTNRSYDNIEVNPLSNIDEEDLREREGYRVKAELRRAIFERTRLNLDVVIGVEATSYTNSDPDFTYDRNRAYVGLRWNPY